MTGIQDDFRSSVPSSHDVFGECGSGLLVATGETEITDLERTVFVEEQVGGFQVSMDDISCMHVVATSQNLEHEVLHMVVCQVLSRVNDSVHVSLHQLSDNVDILVARYRGWFAHFKYFDDVLVVEEFEKADLSYDTFCIDQVLEGLGHLLDSNFLVGVMVVCTTHYTVRTVTNLLDVFKLIVHAECSSYAKSKKDAFSQIIEKDQESV